MTVSQAKVAGYEQSKWYRTPFTDFEATILLEACHDIPAYPGLIDAYIRGSQKQLEEHKRLMAKFRKVA